MSGQLLSKRRVITIVAAALAIAAGGVVWSSASAQSVQWVTIKDTAAGAFTIEVPRGWKTVAQTWQTSAAETGQLATALAPDASIALFLGDPGKRFYLEPNNTTAFGQIPEGQLVNGMMLKRYQSGKQYASETGAVVMRGFCGNVQISEARDLPQQSQMLDFGYQRSGVHFTTAAGEASFTCTFNVSPQLFGAGYIFATTQRGQIGGLNAWSVPNFVGFVALQTKAGEASELLEHFANSLTLDPGWVAVRQGGISDISLINAQTNAAVSTAISNGFWYRRALMDKTFAQGSEARRGVTVYRDTELGVDHELPTGGYKWINPGGTIVTTATPDAPAPGFRQLQRPLMLPGTSR